MKQIILLMALCLLPLSSQAIEIQQAVKTSTEGGRYEIIQSEIMRRYCFKLDKYTGDVYQLVTTKDDTKKWEKMIVVGLPFDEIKPNTINFQIFMGGIAVSDSFMINIHTGHTYQLYKDEETGANFWAYMI